MGTVARRAALRAALAICLGSAVGLVIAEATARLLYEAPWTARLIEEQGAQRRIRERPNHWGLRDREYPTPRPEGHRRIVVLGDSFTVGLGVPNLEDVFTERIEHALNQAPIAGGARRVDVLNAGSAGSLTRDWLRIWNRVADKFEPDVVVIVFFLRDGTRRSLERAFFGPARERAEASARSPLHRWSYLYRWVRDEYDRSQAAKLYGESLVSAYLGTPAETQEWEDAQRNLRHLVALARARGAVAGFVIFPVLVELNAGYPFAEIHRALADFARDDLRTPVHDLLPAFRDRRAQDLWVSPLDQHPNEEGHRIAAQSLLPFVRSLMEDWAARRPRFE